MFSLAFWVSMMMSYSPGLPDPALLMTIYEFHGVTLDWFITSIVASGKPNPPDWLYSTRNVSVVPIVRVWVRSG